MTYPLYPPSNGSHSQPRPLSATADDSRERAIRLLTDAYAYDVITDVEFERRLGQLSVAVAASSIDAVVADLPAAGRFDTLASRTPALERSEGSDASVGTMSAPFPLAVTEGRIVGFMSETRRKGPWRLPQRLTIRAIMCDMKLDLRYAAIPPGCSIDVNAVMANVSFIVPPGMIVDFNVDPVMATARSDAEGGTMEGHAPAHVHISGSAIMAEVRVRVRRYGR
jgi:hypothetical protein